MAPLQNSSLTPELQTSSAFLKEPLAEPLSGTLKGTLNRSLKGVLTGSFATTIEA